MELEVPFQLVSPWVVPFTAKSARTAMLPSQSSWWKHCHQLPQVGLVPAREYKTPDLTEGLNGGQEIDSLYRESAQRSGRWQSSSDRALAQLISHY